MNMSQFDYEIAIRLYAADIPFHALISAAILKADTYNLEKLRDKFPEEERITKQRFNGRYSATKAELEALNDYELEDNLDRAREIATNYIIQI